MNAYQELVDFLGEPVRFIVFGAYGWGSAPREGESWEGGYGEPGTEDRYKPSDNDPPPVPFDVRGKLLDREHAEPFMADWSFYGGYGSPECYAIYAWSDSWVAWVTQYDGATTLDKAPRNPIDIMPSMPGG